MNTNINTANAAAMIDPVTLEVIANALDSIVEEAGETLVRASFSTTIKERRDSSVALFDRQGRTLCQAAHVPLHLGSLIGVVEATLRAHPIETIREGDVFVGNDAYNGGGTHLPDIVLLEPIFIDGEIRAWASNVAHHADFLDRGHAHIFQEGLRIPPVKLYAEGRLNNDLMNLILLNCQIPHERSGDFNAQVAANKVQISRFRGLAQRYGLDYLMTACSALLDYSERRMRAGIAAIPDGTYMFEDDFDSPETAEIFRFSVKIKVENSDIYLDFDAPPQIRASVNLVWTGLCALTYYAVKTLTDPNAPANAGLYRPIHIGAAEGTMLNCVAPAAVDGRASTAQRIADLVHGALAQAIPGIVTAAHNGAMTGTTIIGLDPATGRMFSYAETIGGGFGARATKDGLDGVQVHGTNTSNLPVEALEAEYPILVTAYELVEDSGGAGKWRGGMGIHRQFRIESEESRVDIRGARINSSPWGLFGGGEGARLHYSFEPPLAETGSGSSSKSRPVVRDQILSLYTPGAGGYGDPRSRDPELVRRDLRENRISSKTAREVYGIES
jgi:N-methylhydantoinase B